jgi:hypothetical protein
MSIIVRVFVKGEKSAYLLGKKKAQVSAYRSEAEQA